MSALPNYSDKIKDVTETPRDQYGVDKDSGYTVVPDIQEYGAIDDKVGTICPSVKVQSYESDGRGMLKFVGEKVTEPLTKQGQIEETQRAASEPAAPPLEPVKGKAGRKKVVVKPVEQPQVETVLVRLKGPFGIMAVPCADVFMDGQALVLMSAPGGSFYAPPPGDEPLDISFNGNSIKAYSVGVSFTEPSTGRRFTVLIIGG